MKKTITAKIVRDDDPMSPREWDNLGTMVCWHSRYTLGDEQIHRDDAKETYEGLPDDCEVLPLFLYDHSGITMSTTGFSCGWDSGQVGFTYVTAECIRQEYGDDSKESREKARKVLKGEIEVYDQYLTGDVWGFVIEEKQGECDCCQRELNPEFIDSCWGFYGDCLEAIKGHVDSAYHTALDRAWEHRC